MNTHLLVAELLNDATKSRLWAGIVFLNQQPVRPTQASLKDSQSGQTWLINAWEEWLVPDGSAGLLFARTEVGGMPTGSRRQFDLQVDGQTVASATASTLPDRLPRVDEKPLTLLLSSCFCAAEDKTGRAGQTFSSMPASLRPDLKLLCGDQVYLDSPFYQFLLPHRKQGLAEKFLKNYGATWGQSFLQGGYQLLLSGGSNVFSSDDHEFWNNAPFPSFSVNTLLAQGRQDWWELASGLYAAFQTPASDGTVRRFDVGELPIFVADTRITRSNDRTTFLGPEAMSQLISWIRVLKAPAILNVGQPLFEKKTGLFGNVADWNLPDFEQYGVLCKALLESPQPILILTGDVHFGRVASAVTRQGIELIEVIASPLSLVTGGGRPSWGAPPPLFPPEAIPGMSQISITPLATWDRAKNHFLTIELWQDGGRLGFRVRTWETKPDSGTPTGPVFEHSLQRSL
jgi:hypothetical protein